MAGKHQTIKEQAYEANMELSANHLAIHTWGNVSQFDKDAGVFAIKPSGVPYPELSVDKMVVVDLDENVVEGTLNPSSDTRTHVVLYKEFVVNGGHSVGGIIHTHSPFAVAWAQAVRDVPLFGTTHADHIQTAVPCTPYISKEALEKNYERETGVLIVDFFKERGYNPDEVNMMLCGGHGPFAWGKSAKDAVYNGVVLEEVCKMALYTLTVNPAATPLPDYIVRKHYERKHGPDAYYGQKN